MRKLCREEWFQACINAGEPLPAERCAINPYPFIVISEVIEPSCWLKGIAEPRRAYSITNNPERHFDIEIDRKTAQRIINVFKMERALDLGKDRLYEMPGCPFKEMWRKASYLTPAEKYQKLRSMGIGDSISEIVIDRSDADSWRNAQIGLQQNDHGLWQLIKRENILTISRLK